MAEDYRIKELAELIEKVKADDEYAFEQLYKRCYAHVAFVCSKLSYSKEDAEEVANDTFFAVYKKRHSLRAETFMALLRRIAAYGCYDKRQKNQQDLFEYIDDDNNFAEPDINFLPEEYLINKEAQAELLAIVNNLPEKQREMVYLYYYAGINTEEIAKMQNCPPVNVRKTLHVARNTLKKRLTRQDSSGKGIGTLGAVLFVEEQAFVLNYTGVIGTLELGAASTVAATSITAKGYILASCVAVAIVAATVMYIAWPTEEDYIPIVGAVETQQVTEAITESGNIVRNNIPEVTSIIDFNFEDESSDCEGYGNNDDEPTQLIEPTAQVTQPQPITEAPTTPTYTQPMTAPTTTSPPEPITTPAIPYLIRDPVEQYDYDTPTPEPLDRTLDILASLSAATQHTLPDILLYYDFFQVTGIQDSLGIFFTFYVTDEGSGEILVGIAVNPDGTGWHMKFEHFPYGGRPTDIIDLFDWIEEP